MNTTARISLSVLFTGMLLTGMYSAIVAAPGDPVIAQSPLAQAARIKPAFVMAVDDSGSMNWENLVNNQDGELVWGYDAAGSPWGYFEDDGSLRNGGAETRGDYLELFPFPGRGTSRRTVPPTTNFGFARSPVYNPAYYNPVTVYATWKRSDGTSWQSMDTSAEWQAILVDPRNTGGQTFDLTVNVRMHGPTDSDNTTNSNNDWDFDYYEGMTIPGGTEYWADCGKGTGNTDDWFTVPAGETRVLSGSCDLGVTYFPATYYLATNTSSDGYSGTPLAVVDGPGGPLNTTLYRYEIKPGNYSGDSNGDGTDDYTAAMTNFANWFTYYRSRNLGLVGALTNSFNSIDFLRAGYFTINNRVAVDMFDLEVQTDRDDLYDLMTALPANGSTPNRFAVEHIGVQFERTDDDAPVQIACQANAGMLFTDGYSNQGGPATGEHDSGAQFFGSSASNTLADTAAKYYTASLRSGTGWDDKVEVPDACAGDPNNKGLDCRDDPHMNFYGITLGALGVRYGNAPYINVPGTPEDEARTAAIAANPAWVPPVDDQPSAVDEIWHATLNGRGRFINAKSPADVTTAMREILNAVSDASLNSGGISGAGRRVPGTSDAFVIAPSYAVADGGTDWTGEVTSYEVNADGSIGNVKWTAASQISATGRDVYAVTTPGPSGTVQAGTFTAGNLGPSTTAQLAKLGLTQADVDSLFPGATPGTLVDYLKGDTSDELQNGGVFRNRSALLGDIVNSGPATALPTDNFGYGVFDPTYATFLTTTKASRTPYVFIGANDGMLHAFNATSGAEEFAFIPNGVLANMGQLPSQYYVHHFFVDGDPVIADAKLGGSWQTVLVGTTAAGGRSVYALDIDNPGAFNSTNVMWEFNSSSDIDLGHTFSKPAIAQLENDTWVAIFGNGYGSGDSGVGSGNDPYLYVLDLATGAVLKKLAPVDGSDGAGEVYNGLGQIVVIDTNNNGQADTVYGGDLMGNVWKFDVSGALSSSWNVAFSSAPLFTAFDDASNRQPITGGLAAARGGGNNVMVYFGTGRYFIENDNTVPANPPLQSIYGVSDNGSAITGGRANLVEQDIVAGGATTIATRNINSTAVNYATHRGFYLDLVVDADTNAAGEMLVGNPKVQSGAILFPTFEPLGDPCEPGGQNWLYRLSLRSGAPALQETRMISDDSEVCTGNCGALDIGTGAPQMDVVTFRPEPPTPPGYSCIPGTPGCDELNPEDYLCTEGIAPGGVKVNVVCGRQSWRQVR